MLVLSLPVLADDGVVIQSATQVLGVPVTGSAQITYLITNNTGGDLTGLSYVPSSSQLANIAIGSSCSTLANGTEKCFGANGFGELGIISHGESYEHGCAVLAD